MKKFSFQQQVLTGFAFTLLFVFTLAIVSYISIRERIADLKEDQTWVNYSRDIVDYNNKLLEYLVDAETGERGYILSGDPRFLQPYNVSAGNVNATLKELSNRMLNPPITDTLNQYVHLLLDDMRQGITIYRNQGLAAAQAYIKAGRGKMYMDKIRDISRRIRLSKNVEIIQYVADNQSSTSSDRTLIIILTGSAIILCLVLVLLSYIIRTFKQQKVIEDNVRNTNIRLEEVSEQNKRRNWLLTGTSKLEKSMRGGQDVKELTGNIITELARYTHARIGAIYLLDEDETFLELAGSFAYDPSWKPEKIAVGEGLAGQAAADRRQLLFTDVPANYSKINSATGDTLPNVLLFQPFFLDDQLKGVIELGYVTEPSEVTLQFIGIVVDSVAIAVDTSQARVKLQQLFAKTQQQAEELESQQEELRTTNEELTFKTEALQASEEELQVQQEELRQINSELQEKAEQLAERNRIVDQAREAISAKAEELEQISKYKSEFLANMSHELRTPLNSILILARILKENKAANLNEEQVKYASVIHNAGTDLLTLINDILDLSKIESGKIDLTIEDVELAEIKRDLSLLFKEVAGNKKINFDIVLADDLPARMVSDRVRMEQIIRNLLSNAFKFTPEKGSVNLQIGLAEKDTPFLQDKLKASDQPVLFFSVKDTGIGIPEHKQKAIFEAFQQADGSTSRKYGGTGLGLSISRELANILGGQIELQSTPGEGSVFTLYLPLRYTGEHATETTGMPEKPAVRTESLTPKPAAHMIEPEAGAAGNNGEYTLLIIEDDENFAGVLKDYAADRGFRTVIAYQGDTGLEMAREILPDAIVLDIMLPVIDGWEVLKKLKEDPRTRDIPVHMMSAGDERIAEAERMGAIGFLKKPVVKEKLDEAFDLLSGSGNLTLNKVLIIEDHEIQSENLKQKLAEGGIEVRQAFDGAQAMTALESDPGFDCIILDLNLPDISGLDLLDKIKENSAIASIPVVINTAMELTQEDVTRVMKHTHAMVLKNNKSNDRLIDEVNLFMNKIKDGHKEDLALPAAPKHTATLEKALKDKRVLIVDDDMRNVFAITSALQPYQLQIEIANHGREALSKLDSRPETDLVLMDIMMPEMDGYEAMREIRKQPRFAKLPILALTAKAMKSDRDKCIEAGANDYISKPVDIDKLLSLMRVWIS
jgi:signal transduction histidine kinase/DNA-binding response OmpR family regulator/CHASE3 domain sensor protein